VPCVSNHGRTAGPDRLGTFVLRLQANLRRDWPGGALAVLTILYIMPLWCVISPAMPDYPAHLAGFHLLTSASPSKFYAIEWRLLPNLASDLLVPLFALVLPLEAAAKLFLTLAVGFWVVGAAAIQRALTGRIGVASLAGALFAINANFTWGFLNYTFGAGLCFLVFAAWIAKRANLTPWTLAGFTLAVCVLYVCHLFAACILLVLIGGFELTAILRAGNFRLSSLWPRAWRIAVIFVPALLASLFF